MSTVFSHSKVVVHDCWADGFGRWHVLVPITASRPRELALELIAVQIAERDQLPGEQFSTALDRAIQYLDAANDRVVVNLGENVQRLAGYSMLVEYVEYRLPQDES